MKKIILVCGLISGLIVSGMMVFSTSYYCAKGDFSGGMVYGYASMLLAFSLIFVGIKTFRDKYNGGLISFGKAFKVGAFIVLISSTLYVISWLINYYCFIPDFADKYAGHILEQAKASGANAAEMASKSADMQKFKDMYRNPVIVILLTYVEILPVGLLVAVIAALILKRKNLKTAVA